MTIDPCFVKAQIPIRIYRVSSIALLFYDMSTSITSWHMAISSFSLHQPSLGAQAPSSSCTCPSVGRAPHPARNKCRRTASFAFCCHIAMHRRSSANALSSSNSREINCCACALRLSMSPSCRYPPPMSSWPDTCSTSSASLAVKVDEDDEDEVDNDELALFSGS